MTGTPRTQQGMTLLISLIMLIMITLFVVSMVRLSSTNSAVVGNMQAQNSVDAEAQQAIEIAVNQFKFFDDAIQNAGGWPAGKTSLTYTALWTAYKPAGSTSAASPGTLSSPTKIVISRPQCIYFEPTTGYSALSGVAPQDTYWDIQATSQDTFTGASSEVHQGVQIRMPAGNCP